MDEEENNQARRKAKEGRRQGGLDPLRLEEIFALERESLDQNCLYLQNYHHRSLILTSFLL